MEAAAVILINGIAEFKAKQAQSKYILYERDLIKPGFVPLIINCYAMKWLLRKILMFFVKVSSTWLVRRSSQYFKADATFFLEFF